MRSSSTLKWFIGGNFKKCLEHCGNTHCYYFRCRENYYSHLIFSIKYFQRADKKLLLKMDKNSQAYTDIYALQNGETTACIVKADANKLFFVHSLYNSFQINARKVCVCVEGEYHHVIRKSEIKHVCIYKLCVHNTIRKMDLVSVPFHIISCCSKNLLCLVATWL